MNDPTYTTDDAAPILHPDLSPRTMERWRQQGIGPKFVRIGRRVGYTQAALDEYKARRTFQHTNETRNKP